MRCRDFIRAIAGSSVAWPLVTEAQQSQKMRRLSVLMSTAADDAANTLGIEVTTFDLRRAADIDPAFDAMRGHAQALYVVPIPLIFVNRVRINTLALAARLPTMYLVREYVDAGGLMSYGPNWPHMWARAADFVDKILRGTKPADIPVEQPTKFDLVVNLTTAKAIGLTIPESFLTRVDQIIE